MPKNHPHTTTPPHRTPPLTRHPSNTVPHPHQQTITKTVTHQQTLSPQGFQPSCTQKVCHTNSPHTSLPTHKNIRLTQGEKLAQNLAYTQSILTHTPPSPQKESSLFVFITNITPLCRQGMSFTHSYIINTFTQL